MPIRLATPVLGATSPSHFIDEYDVPTSNSAPLAVTVDKNGIVWFTESNASKLGRFDPSTQTFTEYKVPGVGDMWGITTDPQGNIWLTQYSLKGSVNPGGAIEPGGIGRLIRFNPQNANFTTVSVPTPGAFPFRVAADKDGRIWFTELLGNQIGYYDPSSGELQQYPVPGAFAGPADLTFDNNGALWFTEAYNESVAKFDMQTKTFVEYHFYAIDPTQYVGSPVGISVTPRGIVWVADHGGNWIIEFNSTNEHITRFPTHTPPPQVYPISIPNDLLVDGQGRVWFSEHGGNSIGYLDPRTQTMVEFPIPTGPISTALWIALAPDGDVWFTEWGANKIGVVHSNLPIPLTVSSSANSLILGVGGQASTSVMVQNSGVSVNNGTYAYSWPSYNPSDVNITFSPPNAALTEGQHLSSEAMITASPNVSPGRYMLALGFDAGSVRVWTFVHTLVVAHTSILQMIRSNLWLLVGAIVVVLAVLVAVEGRMRNSKKRIETRS